MNACDAELGVAWSRNAKHRLVVDGCAAAADGPWCG
jgi:hypothetical protein